MEVVDNEDVADQKYMEGHEDNKTYRGAIVLAKYDRYYYPVKVVDIDNVSDSICKKLPTTADKYIIHWYGENNCSAIQKQKVELLGKNQFDKARAEQSPSIQKNYHLTLSDSVEKE